MRKSLLIIVVASVFVVAFFSSPVSAALITGTSSATFINDPLVWSDGLWKYTINMQWDFNGLTGNKNALSHFTLMLDMILCPDSVIDAEGEYTTNFQFEPSPDPALYLSGVDGYTTNDDYPTDTVKDVEWYGFADEVDPTTLMTGPLVKFEQPLLDALGDPIVTKDPGGTGLGEFSFYSVYAPVNGTWADALVGKGGSNVITGELTGDMPYCPVPEPATMLLLSIGTLLLRKRK